ncbi:hypothetical protein C8A03DRAFT_18691 [Achaetomium macrosporum]|uniref:Uncharacterized protein n=1 Tax=Achaetomium macrosporum TaxID=79813 RepID=A0AAN7C3N1_9PEZI|nr:hypothetical protein C8A03DRAFT_18691 [Achaetomium macrosporum]
MDAAVPLGAKRKAEVFDDAAPKKQKGMAFSGASDFASNISSLLGVAEINKALAGTWAATSTTGRTRPSKLKTDELSNVKIKRRDTSRAEAKESNKLTLKSPIGTEESKAELEFARRRMESKARLYAAMQRGDYIGREIGLVDFDRKWAESQSNNPASPSSTSSDSEASAEEDNIDTTLHEYTDEFGRVRHLTRAQILRLERRSARAAASATELEHMSVRPKAPEQLIIGDAVQADAFTAQDLETMETLARKRDRSPTPPEPTHYQADKEIRTKGVGFYKFSQEEKKREEEMKALEEERARTVRLREEREEQKKRRKMEIEARRKELAERRATKLTETFLDGLGKDLAGGS